MDEKELKKLLGENIRRIRKSRGLTQDIFSEKIGIEPSSLSNIENGKSLPSTQTIINIQQQFSVTPNEIFEIDYLRNNKYLDEAIFSALKELDVERKRVLYKIVKAIGVGVEASQKSWLSVYKAGIVFWPVKIIESLCEGRIASHSTLFVSLFEIYLCKIQTFKIYFF